MDEKYQEKRAVWLECLCGEDQHSIHSQIRNMLWNTAVFKVVNEARRLTPEAEEGGVQVNGPIHNLIDQGYFTMQATAIRRLIDKHPLHGERGVYSLKRLLIDIHENRLLVTRQNMMAAEGRPYDAELTSKKYEQFVQKKRAEGAKDWGVPKELIVEMIENRHREIDQLTGTKPTTRKPDDILCDEIIEEMGGRLDHACKDIGTHATKFMAHASTPESRQAISDRSKDPTFGMLLKAEQVLAEIAGFISILILGGSPVAGLAIPRYDQFVYIDRPLVNSEQVTLLKRIWDEYSHETHTWDYWVPNIFREPA